MNNEVSQPQVLPTPSIRRRLVCMVYESFLLFGVIFVGAFVFDKLTDSRHALHLRHARMAWLFLLIGVYFAYCWLNNGQTLAMKTWRIQLRSQQGSKLSVQQVVLRYLLSWMWFLPALALDAIFGLKLWPSIGVVSLGFVFWASLAWLDKERQFLHDKLAKTRLVLLPSAAQIAKEKKEAANQSAHSNT